MKRILILFTILVAASFARAQDIAGDWQGTLSANGAVRLRTHTLRL